MNYAPPRIKAIPATHKCLVDKTGAAGRLQTSLGLDLAVSLARGRRFLETFEVPSPVRVAFISGESGEWAIQETAQRIREAKNINLENLDGLLIDCRLPQLGRAEELEALAEGLLQHSCDVVVLDPLYLALLAGTDAQASNLYDMGPLLYRVARTCLDAGATPIFMHHARKALTVGAPMELEDLAFAGIAEFARQWLLINRRERFDPEAGTHKLWLSAGGNCGQAGLWAVDVTEGRLGDDFGGRTWEVRVATAGEHRELKREEKESAKRTKRT